MAIGGTVGTGSGDWAFEGTWFSIQDTEQRNITTTKTDLGESIKRDTFKTSYNTYARRCITSVEHVFNSGSRKILDIAASSAFFPPSYSQPTAGLAAWYSKKPIKVEVDFSEIGVATISLIEESVAPNKVIVNTITYIKGKEER